jgi:hypothetical protein
MPDQVRHDGITNFINRHYLMVIKKEETPLFRESPLQQNAPRITDYNRKLEAF